MPLLQIDAVVISDPDGAFGALPNQNFERKIKGDARGCNHERRPRLWIAEDQQLAGEHFEPCLFGLAAVIYQGKQFHTFGDESFLEAFDGFVDRVIGTNGDYAILGVSSHECLSYTA